jgi:hypothetical protein
LCTVQFVSSGHHTALAVAVSGDPVLDAVSVIRGIPVSVFFSLFIYDSLRAPQAKKKSYIHSEVVDLLLSLDGPHFAFGLLSPLNLACRTKIAPEIYGNVNPSAW